MLMCDLFAVANLVSICHEFVQFPWFAMIFHNTEIREILPS